MAALDTAPKVSFTAGSANFQVKLVAPVARMNPRTKNSMTPELKDKAFK